MKRYWLSVPVLLLALWVAYLPGLSGPFLFDDLPNFLHNREVRMTSLDVDGIQAAVRSWGEGTIPNRGLARLSFALNYLGSGGRFEARDMKVTNLSIHGLNALLVGLLCGAFARRLQVPPRVPAPAPWQVGTLAAFVWALHPIQLTAVLYVVQRMTGLSATFVLLGLLGYMALRERLPERPLTGALGLIATLVAAAGLGYLCKQNAILVIPLAALVELVFYERVPLSSAARRALAAVFGVLLLLPILAALAYLPDLLDWLMQGYVPRDFDLVQRLLTQARVLVLYLGLLVFPHPEHFALWHDGIGVSLSLISPATTLACVLAVLGLVALAVPGLLARRPWAFAIAFFLVAHLLESSVVALELVYEHRNYLPSVGLAFAAAWYGLAGARTLRLGTFTLGITVCGMVLVLGTTLHARASQWGDDLALAQRLVRVAPGSYRSHQYLADALQRRGAPGTHVYEAFRRAAVAPGEAVLPVMRMRRLLAAMQFALEDAAPVDRSQERATVTLPGVWSQPLDPAPAHLDALVPLVEAEVVRRLAGRVTHAETVAELDRIERCLRENRDTCWGMRETLATWIETALSGGRPYRTVRVRLHFLASSLAAMRGDPQEALERLLVAESEHGSRPAPRHLKVIYLARLGRIEEARALLDAMDSEGEAVREGMAALERARRVLDRLTSAR